MADIFISYSRPDRAVIQALAEDLAKAGASVWWDRELLAGDPYHKLIPAEIAACRVAIVLWTSHSIHSEWVLSEVRRAGDKPIQPSAANRAISAASPGDAANRESGASAARTSAKDAASAACSSSGKRSITPPPAAGRARARR